MIVVTGVPSIPTAIESVRLGIADYLPKPVKFEELPWRSSEHCFIQAHHRNRKRN